MLITTLYQIAPLGVPVKFYTNIPTVPASSTNAISMLTAASSGQEGAPPINGTPEVSAAALPNVTTKGTHNSYIYDNAKLSQLRL